MLGSKPSHIALHLLAHCTILGRYWSPYCSSEGAGLLSRRFVSLRPRSLRLGALSRGEDGGSRAHRSACWGGGDDDAFRGGRSA